MKEQISQNEIDFLLFVLASEDSMLIELHWEFEKWGCKVNDVMTSLSKLINGDRLLISKRSEGSFSDLSIASSLDLVSNWEQLSTNEFILFLTENGEKQWEQDDFGITTERANHLMFSNQGQIARVQ